MDNCVPSLCRARNRIKKLVHFIDGVNVYSVQLDERSRYVIFKGGRHMQRQYFCFDSVDAQEATNQVLNNALRLG